MKVLIIGGGASGMMAALSALENPNNTVTLLERQSRVGKKLLAVVVRQTDVAVREIAAAVSGREQLFAHAALPL